MNNPFVIRVSGNYASLRQFRERLQNELSEFEKIEGTYIRLEEDNASLFNSPSIIGLIRDAVRAPSYDDVQEILAPAHSDLYTGSPYGLARQHRVEKANGSIHAYMREAAVRAAKRAISRDNIRQITAERMGLVRPGQKLPKEWGGKS